MIDIKNHVQHCFLIYVLYEMKHLASLPSLKDAGIFG